MMQHREKSPALENYLLTDTHSRIAIKYNKLYTHG